MFNNLKKFIIFGVLLFTTAQLFSITDSRYGADTYRAFNQKAGDVDPQTGNVSHSVTDVLLPGRAGFDFSFGRTWSLNNSNVFNMTLDRYNNVNKLNSNTSEKHHRLGVGWRSNIPYLHKDDGDENEVMHLFFQGNAYQVNHSDMSTSASENNIIGYDLLDIRIYEENNSRIRYSIKKIPEGLPSTTEQAAYVLILKDRSGYFFRESGQLMMHCDSSGRNEIWYYYDNNNRLKVVLDSVGREIKFNYDTNGNLSEVSWIVSVWQKDTNGNRKLCEEKRSVKYTYKNGEDYSDISNSIEEIENYVKPYALVGVKNPASQETKYTYKADLAGFSFTEDSIYMNNTYLLLTSIKSNYYEPDMYSAAKFYEYNDPDIKNYRKDFYTGYIDHFRVIGSLNHNKYKRVMNKTLYNYFHDEVSYSDKHYETEIIQDKLKTTYSYSLEEYKDKFHMLDYIKVEELPVTSNSYYNVTDYTYDDFKTKTMEELSIKGDTKYVEYFTYDNKGQLLKHKDKLKNESIVTYHPNFGIPTEERTKVYYNEILSDEYVKNYELNSWGKVITTKLDNIIEQKIEYDQYGNTVSVENTKGQKIHTIFDKKSLFPIYSWIMVTLVEGEDPVEVGARSIYNSDGTKYMELDQEGNTIEYFYDEIGRVVEVVSPTDQDVKDGYDSINHKEIDDLTQLEEGFSFSSFIESRKENPTLKTIFKDKESIVITETDLSDGKILKTSAEADGLGNVEKETTYSSENEVYGETIKTYDSFGRMISLTDSDADYYSSTTAQTSGHNITKYDKTWIIEYDFLGRQKAVYYPQTSSYVDIKKIEYDDNDNTVTTTEPLRYDNSSLTPVSTVTSDYAGNIISISKSSLGDPSNVRTYTYTYDSMGRKRSFTDPNEEKTLYEYNNRSQITKQTFAGNTNSLNDIMTYNELGQLTKKIDRNGNQILTEYDELGRPVKVSRYYPDEVEPYDNHDETTKLLYNKRGLNYKVEGNELIETFEFDSKGQLIKQDSNIQTESLKVAAQKALPAVKGLYTFTYKYNEGGLLTEMEYPDNGIHKFNYRNYTGFLDSIQEVVGDQTAKNFVSEIEYNNSGVVTSMEWRNGVKQKWTFDNRKRIRNIEILKSDNNLIEELKYNLNGSGDIVSINNSYYEYNEFGELSFSKIELPGYDIKMPVVDNSFGSFSPSHVIKNTRIYNIGADLNSDGRVNGSDHYLAYLNDKNRAYDTEEFSYDKSGNRLTLTQNSDTYSYNYGERNRLLSIIKDNEEYISFEYDNNGNTITKTVKSNTGDEITTYKYDTINRLIETTSPEGKTSRYYYDNSGNRFAKEILGDKTTIYLRQGEIAIAMDLEITAEDDTKVNRYVLSGNLIAGKVTTENNETTESYYHLDHLNSTKVVTDQDEKVVVNYEYRAFGDQLKRLGEDKTTSTEDHAKYSYGGKELDETNLYYFNARYYDATTGRFINVDPIQDGTNWYIYCNNNPLNMVDPTGLLPLPIPYPHPSSSLKDNSIKFAIGVAKAYYKGVKITSGILLLPVNPVYSAAVFAPDIFKKYGLKSRYGLGIEIGKFNGSVKYDPANDRIALRSFKEEMIPFTPTVFSVGVDLNILDGKTKIVKKMKGVLYNSPTVPISVKGSGEYDLDSGHVSAAHEAKIGLGLKGKFKISFIGDFKVDLTKFLESTGLSDKGEIIINMITNPVDKQTDYGSPEMDRIPTKRKF